MNAADTNVLLYVHDPRDVTKQATAANLLQSSLMAYCFGKLFVNIWQQAANWSLSVITLRRPTKTCKIFSAFGR